jgi:glycolate oxidase
VVTEAWLRILPKPEGARPVLMGFDSNEVAGACVADIIRAGILPVAIEFMDRPCIRACEAFAKAGYPDCEALLIIEVEGSPGRDRRTAGPIRQIALAHDPVEFREAADEDQARRIWLGRKSAFGAMGQINDYMCLDGTIPVSSLPHVLRRIGEMSREFGLDVGNVFHAGDGNMHPLILYDANKPGDLERCEAFGAEILKLCVEVGGCLTGEHGVGIEKRDLMAVQFAPGGPGGADAGEGCVRSEVAAEPGQGVSAGRQCRAARGLTPPGGLCVPPDPPAGYFRTDARHAA